MTILVTGSEGFIGKQMLSVLTQRGIDAIGYDTKVDDFHIFDVIDFSDIECVMHFGAISSTTEKNLPKIIKYNYEFTTDLIDTCYVENIPIQIASSASVYGQTLNMYMCEDDSLDPKSPYALSKYLCERYATKMIEQFGCNIQILRYFNVWSEYLEGGKEQPSPHFRFKYDAFLRQASKLFDGSDRIFRDFIHIDTLIDIQLKLYQTKETGIFNVGTGVAKSFESVAKKYNGAIMYIPFPEHLKEHYQYYTCADMTKTNEAIKNV